jgi:Holliday junction resolvase RusA-like endonuclease
MVAARIANLPKGANQHASIEAPSQSDAAALLNVVSLNLRRRHLDESQRALVAARIANLGNGQRSDHVEGVPIGTASAMLNVSERTTKRAREVLRDGAPELVNAVQRGRAEQARGTAMNEFRLVIYGEPVAKARPRMGVVNGHARAYTPKATRSYEAIVRETCVREWRGPLLSGVALSMDVRFYLRVPASKPKRWQAAALSGDVRPTTKPDLSNLVKSVEDGMQGAVFQDDCAIVDTRQGKFYGAEPRVEVLLRWGQP